jgi:translation initiation factor 1
MRLFEGTPFDIIPKCDRCGREERDCQCPPLPQQRTPPEKQRPRISVEKRKKGKVVTVIRDLASENDSLAELLVNLKNSCGAGGTIKDDTIEIQGDHSERIRQLLSGLGFKFR